jgi:hypothetical protein
MPMMQKMEGIPDGDVFKKYLCPPGTTTEERR